MILVLAALLMPAQEEVWPLREGASWTYETSAERTFTQRVIGSATLKGAATFIVRQGDAGARHWMSVDGEGVKVHQSVSGGVETPTTVTFETPMVIVKLPLTKGEEWKAEGKVGTVAVRYAFRNEGEEELKVPAGTYKAWKISWRMTQGSEQSSGATWVAKGVGPVRQSFGSGGQEHGMSLSRFELPVAELVPLAKGMRWVYATNHDQDITYEVTGTESVGGTECFVVEHRSDARVLTREWLAGSAEGVRVHRVGRGKSTVFEVEKPFLKVPAGVTKGQRWEGRGTDGEGTAVTYRHEAVGEEAVEVPAGRFTAWKIKTEVQTGEAHRATGTQWYARGVGLVRYEMTLTGGTDVTYELKEFRK